MADRGPARLTDLLSGTRRLALVGLAKNTGKTETLTSILAEHAAAGTAVGVTSIGRDGEARDVIDARIEKPLLRLQAGSLVATSGGLLRASAVAHEQLERTGVRTPLGEVVIARLSQAGTVEVAGPSAGADLRTVSDAMAALGAERVLIDGSIDRRAAASPAVADGLVVATGAVLDEDIEQVIEATADAVEVVRLPQADAREKPVALDRGLVLSGEPGEIARLLEEQPQASSFLIEGALSERFLDGLLAARAQRAGRELRIVVGDPTKVFLSHRGPGWYQRQGLFIEVLTTIDLRAITVNPVAPQSHRFDSEELREGIEAAVPGVPVLDVLDPAYLALAK
jgi:hypothetical protein